MGLEQETARIVAAMPGAKLDELADVVRRVGRHCEIAHDCPDTAAILAAVADRLGNLHAGVMSIANHLDPMQRKG